MLHKPDRKTASQLVPDRTWLIMMILLATALRLLHLGKQSLWLDEAWSFALIAAPLKIGLENMLTTGVYVPLYFLLLRPLNLIGQSETIEARMYTMVVFFNLGAIYFFLRATKENTWKTWAGLVVFSALAYSIVKCKLCQNLHHAIYERSRNIEGYERLWLIYHRVAPGQPDSHTKWWLDIHRKDVLEEKDLPGLHIILYRLSLSGDSGAEKCQKRNSLIALSIAND